MRYEHPDDKYEETRRERNERVGEITPLLDIPEVGEYLWVIFQSIIRSLNRVTEGSYRLISPPEWESWLRLTRTIVYSREYDILVAMDRVYCEEANKEIADVRAQQDEEIKKKTEQSSKKR